MGTEKAKFKDEFRQRVYRFALDIIRYVEQLPKEQTSRIISGQLLRSATSIGANVVEAQGASSRKDYTNFFSYSRLKLKNSPVFSSGIFTFYIVILTFNLWFLNFINLWFLNSFGFQTEVFIPISALVGDNVYRKGKVMEWYRGPTLIETLDGVKLSREEKPLRFVVQDIYSVGSERIIVGRVESGLLQKGDEVIFEPSGIKGVIERIIVFDADLEEAGTGDSIGVVIKASGVKRGDVFGLLETPPKPVNEFLGEAVLLDKSMKKGDTLELRCGTAKVACKIKEIKEKINLETGEVMGERSEEIFEHDAATIVFATEPVVVEEFAEIPELGRFVLVKADKNIGAGVVLDAN